MVDGLRLNYETVGEGPTVMLLHGWGGCIASMAPIQQMLSHKYQVLSVDLPGFGRSERPPTTWSSDDYGRCIAELAVQLGVERFCAIVGHSFGGKVAICVAVRRPDAVGSLILVGTPGIRLPLSGQAKRRIAGVKMARRASRFLPAPLREALADRLSRLGSDDYRNAGDMRAILVRVVNEDLRGLLPMISPQTLLVWGEQDDAAPLPVGKAMERLIPGAGLVVLSKSGHFPYLDEPRAFSAVVHSFLASVCAGGAS